ncbi:sigma-54 dependent transcriptional regulator [Lysobacter sp. GX 14042]|uniref:sigma-54 interaction domain-containing protein n=1 Tax=Lysobacter sp. GX 14042 TaxID=2907155 RepID=UPI001F2A3D0E|nr:sigma-54 dependent transcriptional regulator [Lysobacter sp. GX 14042]MCE7032328.1 sigma-54 dependent transcriptional regulator [Lysobacter sp. GX 14042]
MAAVTAGPGQCVVWFGEPLARERKALAAAGWQLRAIPPGRGRDGIGLRAGDTVVGMLDLREADAAAAGHAAQLAGEYRHLPFLAIIPRRLAQAPALAPLLAQCRRHFTRAPDTEALIAAVTELAGPPAPQSTGGLDALVGRSPAMLATIAAIRKFAPIDLPTLITGQTGTGKEVAARALHDLSPRAGRVFAPLNCGAIPDNLVQSELFGHERGAFTGATARRTGLFEAAHGGTVFLDEIGDLPLDAQTNLLRVLQEGTIERVGSHQPVETDVRVIAATHVDLEQAIAAGRFRADLYYRLNVLRLRMPPVADRGEDIVLLAQHFLDRFRQLHATRARGFSAGARRAMAAFDWPGNVRELLNRVQRAAVVAESELISAGELELPEAGPAPGGRGLDRARIDAERDMLLGCLRDSGYNVSQAARRLGVSRMTVYRLCRKHQLPVTQLRRTGGRGH